MLQDPNSWSGLLTQYGRAVGWSITAAVGFAHSILTCNKIVKANLIEKIKSNLAIIDPQLQQ